MSRALLMIPLLCAVLAACGGANKSQSVAKELSVDELKAFDGGVDFVDKPSGLQGRWRDDWLRDLKMRVQQADLVAVVNVKTLRTAIGEEGEQHHLVLEVAGAIKGSEPGRDLALPSFPSQPGYNTVEANRDRLAGQDFLLYLKWVETSDKLIPHWHLSVASSEVLGFSKEFVDN